MPIFFKEVRHLPGKDKLNVYALIVAKLSRYSADKIEDRLFIRALIPDIKILFNNHEQQFAVLAFILKHHLKAHTEISENLKSFIRHVIESVEDVAFQTYYKRTTLSTLDLHCRLGRFFESNIAINMLQNPSPETWKCINKISSNIIKFIEANDNGELYEHFLADLGPDPKNPKAPKLALAFARFAETPGLKDIVTTLTEQKDFARIMLIHFMFMRDVYPLCEPDMETQARIKRVGYGGDLAKYISTNEDQDFSPFFFNYTTDPLYRDRGRGPFKLYLSKKLGICLTPEDRIKLPSIDTAWCPDSICQVANLRSPYTQSLILHDIPYVAGPSGMTTLLSAGMLFMGRFESMQEHLQYILAIMVFITGGGLHSIHEVLTVPHVRLGLLKSFNPYGPNAGNYNEFFNLFRHDEVVMENINKAWDATISLICEEYPDLIPIGEYTTQDKLAVALTPILKKEKPFTMPCQIL